MFRWISAAIATVVLPSIAVAQPFNVRAWYAEGQVFVVWQMPAPPAAATDTVEIYASAAAQPDTMFMTQIGRLFFPEYTGGRLNLMLAGARILVPTPAGGTYRLAVDEGVFVHTPHQAGNLFFAVVDTGSTIVGALNSAAAAFGYDPVNNPVRPHWQFDTFTPGGNPSAAYIVWADGRADYTDNRPDIPVLASAQKNGVPHVFAITLPIAPLPPDSLSCLFVMHGGNDLYSLFRPGQPQRGYMSLPLTDGIVVTPDDAIYWNNQNNLVLDNTDWFGYHSELDPFTSAVRSDPPADAVIVNYSQRRVLWILESLLRPASPYALDPARVAMVGHSMGARGTSHLTRMRPERFCAAVCYCPPNDFTIPPQPGQVSPLRGHLSLNLDTNLSFAGVVLGIQDVCTPTTRLSATERDVPLTRFHYGKRDEQGSAAWSVAQRAVLDALNDSRMGHMVLWDEREHGIPDWSQEANDATDGHAGPWPDIGQWVAPIRTYRAAGQYLVDQYRADQSYPGFFNVDLDPVLNGRQPDPGDGDPDLGDPYGTWGGYCDWDATSIVDESDRWECTLFLEGLSAVLIDNSPVSTATADISLRRTQQFNPAEATSLWWRLLDADTDAILQSGSVTAGAEGLVIVTGLTIGRDPDRARLVVSIYVPADMNCDGSIDFFDIDPFLLALFDPAAYAAAYPVCDAANADVNADNSVDFFDIDSFLACLFGSCP